MCDTQQVHLGEGAEPRPVGNGEYGCTCGSQLQGCEERAEAPVQEETLVDEGNRNVGNARRKVIRTSESHLRDCKRRASKGVAIKTRCEKPVVLRRARPVVMGNTIGPPKKQPYSDWMPLPFSTSNQEVERLRKIGRSPWEDKL